VTAEHPAAAALEHLQRAALELLGAARSGLHLVEDMVADPRGVSGLVGELAHAARVLLSEPPAGRSTPAGPGGPFSGAAGRTRPDDPGDHPGAGARRAPVDPEDGAPARPFPGGEGGRGRHRPRVQRVPLT
jgi:hypothetical protein